MCLILGIAAAATVAPAPVSARSRKGAKVAKREARTAKKLAKRGDLAGAAEALVRAWKARPRGKFLLSAAKLYEKAGEGEQVRAVLEELADADVPEAKEAQRRLEALQKVEEEAEEEAAEEVEDAGWRRGEEPDEVPESDAVEDGSAWKSRALAERRRERDPPDERPTRRAAITAPPIGNVWGDDVRRDSPPPLPVLKVPQRVDDPWAEDTSFLTTKGPGLSSASLTMLGAAAALLAVGSMFGVSADIALSNLKSDEGQRVRFDDLEEEHNLAVQSAAVANVCFVGAAVSLVVGTAMWGLGFGTDPENP